jgi:putative ABC transport system permease protein
MKMPDRQRTAYRVLACLLPAELRQTAGAELEEAALACLVRERQLRGRAGVALAWLHLLGDTVGTALSVRRARAGRHDIARHPLSRPPRGFWETVMDNLLKDLKHALRTLRRQPGFTVVTILTLALGIGANTAIFSVVNGVLLRPLAYPHPEQLEFLTTTFPKLGFDQFWMSIPEFLEFRDNNSTFQSVGAYSTGAVNLGTDPAIRPTSAVVTSEFMPTLGVRPIAGRWFVPEDTRPGADPVVILGGDLWRRAFGSDPTLLGRRVMIDGVSNQVVGIMPAGYDVHEQKVELWQPLTIPNGADLLNQDGSHFLYGVGRLKTGVSAAQAQADINHMLDVWSAFVPKGTQDILNHGQLAGGEARKHALRMDPLKTDIVGSISRALVILQGAVLFVLVIACANLANLLLARAESRQREFAVRSALGAGRRRLFAQFVTEGLVLAALAAGVGTGLAFVAVRGLVALSPDTIPRAAEIALDWRVLLFTLLLTVVTGFVFGLTPLLSAGAQLATALRQGTRTSAGARRAVRSGLVIAEVALAVTLVVGAGLLVRSFVNLLRVDAGFDRSRLVTFGIVPPVLGNPKTPQERQARRQRFVDSFERLREALNALPGVQNVTAMSGLPPNRPVLANDTDFEWIPNAPPGQAPDPRYPVQNVDYWQYVTLNFAETLGVPVVKGRAFARSDVGGQPVAIVNEALVRKFFTDRDPIGERLKPGFGNDLAWFTIVGVFKDIKQGGVDAPAGTELYLLEDQLPQLTSITTNMNFVLRTTQPVAQLAGPIRQAVHNLDPSLPIVKLESMDDVFGESVARPEFLTTLLGIFASLALALAAVGTYGILSYLVSERTQEIGIRMTLGADRNSILRHFLVRGLFLAGAGLALGLVAALFLTTLIRALLFNVSPTDPMTLALVGGVMAVVAAAACVVPAWRATRVDPIVVLRQA